MIAVPAAVVGFLSKIASPVVIAGESIIKYPLQWIVVGLICSNVTTYTLWQSNHKAFENEKAAHVQTVSNYKAAQAEADAKANLIKETLTLKAKADAQQADSNYASLLSKYNANLLRYKATQSVTIQPSNNPTNPTSESGNGPSTGPQLPEAITISMGDAEICAINTARLQTVREWTQTLSKE
jgi:hypothetical protein